MSFVDAARGAPLYLNDWNSYRLLSSRFSFFLASQIFNLVLLHASLLIVQIGRHVD
jgi:hypothetical protein